MPTYNNENIRIVNDSLLECFNYVKENFDDICPFTIVSGYDFQLFLTEKQYSEVPEKHREELRKFALKSDNPYINEDETRYRKDFFWIPANRFIFSFDVVKALILYTECGYGPEGMEKHVDKIVFINNTELSPFILSKLCDKTFLI